MLLIMVFLSRCPFVTMSFLKSHMESLPIDEKIRIKSTAGVPVPGLEVKISTSEGREARMDGNDMGEICFLRERVAKWWGPEEVVFLDQIPKTSVGKFSKKELRKTIVPLLSVKDFDV